jgi:4-diphosphocytidyl-2-C-methyl-D-erythritol kinase
VTPFRIAAHAKINLHLAILGRRPDGYHDVETVLQTIALHDTLTCEPWDGPLTLHSPGLDVPNEANLVMRAAVLLAQAAGLTALPSTFMTLEKRIPTQAGLGGGSADAAATLVGLSRLWQLPIDAERLRAIGARLGADVPFFIDGGTALGVGRGDELRALPDLPPHAVLVVMPPVGVSTADAYRWLDEARQSAADVASAAGDGTSRWPETPSQWRDRLSRCVNDFEPVVGTRLAVVPDAVARLKDAGATFAAMSGSGAAIFGLFETQAAAESAAKNFNLPGWRTFVSQTMDRASYQQSIRVG